MADFTMPSLGADMDEGTLLEWLIKPGDVVKKGDIVAVVDTAKSAVDIETFHAGTVTALLIEPGATVPVGTPIATMDLDDQTEAVGPTGSPEETEPVSATEPATAASSTEEPLPAPLEPTGGGVRISPFARTLAAELGVDIEPLWRELGRPIHEADVRAAAAKMPTSQKPTATSPVSAEARAEQMRAAIARLMSRSKREIPHYYLSLTLDLEPALAWMHDRNKELPVEERLLPAALLLRATALATAETPELNGYWVDDAFEAHSSVNLGMAISLRGGGLVTPCIHDAASLGLTDLMAAIKDLTLRARAGRLRGSELTDGTITVTNLGEQGVDLVHGVIYPPQVALVGFGRPAVRPWVLDGEIVSRTLTEATLAADHRASDGFTGSRFLARLADHLTKPELL